jgi:hypothetical protein
MQKESVQAGFVAHWNLMQISFPILINSRLFYLPFYFHQKKFEAFGLIAANCGRFIICSIFIPFPANMMIHEIVNKPYIVYVGNILKVKEFYSCKGNDGLDWI